MEESETRRAISVGAGIGGATGAATTSISAFSPVMIGVAAAAGALTGYAGYVAFIYSRDE